MCIKKKKDESPSFLHLPILCTWLRAWYPPLERFPEQNVTCFLNIHSSCQWNWFEETAKYYSGSNQRRVFRSEVMRGNEVWRLHVWPPQSVCSFIHGTSVSWAGSPRPGPDWGPEVKGHGLFPGGLPNPICKVQFFDSQGGIRCLLALLHLSLWSQKSCLCSCADLNSGP